jgi:uncharacterized protein (DUF2236 family)
VATIAERLGARQVPRSRVALRAYFREVRGELEAGEQALGAMAFLVSPLRGNPVMSAAHGIVVKAAIGLLPGWARDMLGVPHPGLADRALVLPAAHLLLGTLRFAGGEPVPVVEARRRCAAEPVPEVA